MFDMWETSLTELFHKFRNATGCMRCHFICEKFTVCIKYYLAVHGPWKDNAFRFAERRQLLLLPVTRIPASFAVLPDMKCFITSPQHGACRNVTYGVVSLAQCFVYPSYSSNLARSNIRFFGPCREEPWTGRHLPHDDEMKTDGRRWMQTQGSALLSVEIGRPAVYIAGADMSVCVSLLCGQVEGLPALFFFLLW